jgi:hypothetical protein
MIRLLRPRIANHQGGALVRLNHKRKDELTKFVLISDPAVQVTWKIGKVSSLYHATSNGRAAICNGYLDLTDDDPYQDEDRSNCVMTCNMCAERVRKDRQK